MNAPANGKGDGAMPHSVSQSEVKIGSVTLVVHQLDNGRRVIEADSMHAFMAALEDGSLLLTDEDSMRLAKVLR